MPKTSTSFKKGNSGKPKGAVNKTTRLVKEVFAETFNELQKDPKVKLTAWAKDNPTEFYKLASKLIPIQIGGDPENPINSIPEIKVYTTAPPLSNSEDEIKE